MRAFLGIVLLAGASLGLYLAVLLSAIRRRGYGEGKPLDLPPLGLFLTYPGWWTLETGAGSGGDGASPPVRLRTGHRRGLVTIEPVGTVSSREDPDALKTILLEVLCERNITLDEVEIHVSPIGPPGSAPIGLHAAVASGGRQGSRPDERTYFELHLVRVGSGAALISYTNAVLQGFLDAFYIERMIETVRPRIAA